MEKTTDQRNILRFLWLSVDRKAFCFAKSFDTRSAFLIHRQNYSVWSGKIFIRFRISKDFGMEKDK